MSATASRTAKATEARLGKRNNMRDSLYEVISTSDRAITDWQLAFHLDLPLPAVRLALIEDPRFVPLMRAQKIAVPAQTLKYPKWATMHLTVEELAALPTVTRENKLSGDILPVVVTGNDALDSDFGQLESEFLDAARRMPPRRARAKLQETIMIFGRTIEQTAKTIEENESLRIANRAVNTEVKRLTKDNQRLEKDNDRLTERARVAEQKLAHLDTPEQMPSVPPMETSEELRPH